MELTSKSTALAAWQRAHGAARQLVERMKADMAAGLYRGDGELVRRAIALTREMTVYAADKVTTVEAMETRPSQVATDVVAAAKDYHARLHKLGGELAKKTGRTNPVASPAIGDALPWWAWVALLAGGAWVVWRYWRSK